MNYGTLIFDFNFFVACKILFVLLHEQKFLKILAQSFCLYKMTLRFKKIKIFFDEMIVFDSKLYNLGGAVGIPKILN